MTAEKAQNTACTVVAFMRWMPNDSANTKPNGDSMTTHARTVGRAAPSGPTA